MAVDDLTSLFSHQENVEELKQKVLLMASELQSVRIQAVEQARKNKQAMDTIKHLLHLLQIAYKERDEARAQLHRLLLSTTVSAAGETPSLSPEAESNCKPLISHGSSRGDSLYDVVCGLNGAVVAANPAQKAARIAESESAVVVELARGRALPEKGKLLNAVMEAGPLLQTLMVAGPLPRWLNPPPPPAESAEGGAQLVGTAGLCSNDAVWTPSIGGETLRGGNPMITATKRHRVL